MPGEKFPNPFKKSELDLKEISDEVKTFHEEIISESTRVYNRRKEQDDIKEKFDNIKTLKGIIPYIDKVSNSLNTSIREIAKSKLKLNPKFTKSVIDKYNNLEYKGKEKPDFFPFFCAYRGYEKMKRKNGYLMIVDYSKPANSNRCYLINTITNKIEITTTCEQGIGKEGKSQPGFSNIDGSWQSSIGISQTEQATPTRNFGIRDSLVVSGKEHSNSMSAERHILVHKGNISHGCFVFKDRVKGGQIINKLKNYGTIFSYYPDADYLKKSEYV